MTRMKHIAKFILTIAAIVGSATVAQALPQDFFTRTSKLSSGKWVKIRVAENGIYELSYEDLRAAGFTNPEAVGVFGRGGIVQPSQFIPATGDPALESPYEDDLKAVPVLHRAGKIYFYGQGPSEIYSQPVDNQLFVRKSINTYSLYGYYLLSDIEGARVDAPVIAAPEPEDVSAAVNTCLDYFYHESDKHNFMLSGTHWLGESFLDHPQYSFEWDIPGVIPDAPGSLQIVAGQSGFTTASSYITATLDSQNTEILKTNFASAIGEDMYTLNQTGSTAFSFPLGRDRVSLSFSGTGSGTMARLDYLLLGLTKQTGLSEGEAQSRAFLNNCTESGLYGITGLNDNTVVWEVASSNDIHEVEVWKEGELGYVCGLPAANSGDDSRHSVLMVFDTAKEQMRPEVVGEVANQNLHATETPDLVIITTETLYDKAQELADLHRNIEGMDVVVVKGPDLYNEFSAGTPDAMAYRAFCKMLYDRDPSKLKNVLLFGEVSYDNRQITFEPQDNLLSHMYAPRDQSLTNSFMLNDYFGMMQDTYRYVSGGAGISQSILNEMYWMNRSQEIGVGVLPFRNAGDADIMLTKLAQYLTDDTFGYWGGNYQWTSDQGDSNLHLTSMLGVMNNHMTYSNGDFTNLQAHVSAFPEPGRPVHRKFVNNLEQGSLFSAYLGHGMDLWISEVLKFNDNALIRNDRLSFMVVGGCTISEFSNNDRGVIDNLLLETNYGFIGSMISNRAVWADDNRALLNNFFNATVLNDPSAKFKTRLEQPRTIGEVYAKAKTLTNTSTNKFAYHLMSDPALTVPLSTHAVKLDPSVDLSEAYPGTSIPVSGKVYDRADNAFSDFNGYVVLSIFEPAKTEGTYARNDNASVDVTYEDICMASVSIPVSNGEFSGSINIPPTYTNTEEAAVAMRMCAFDPETRLLATGNTSLNMMPYNQSKAQTDTECPVVQQMYANSPDAERVLSNFTLYATVSDNTAMSLATGKVVTDFAVLLDGKLVGNAQRYVTLDDMGKTMKVTMPFRNIADGIHLITLQAKDIFGNGVQQTLQVQVGAADLTPELTLTEKVARTCANIELSETSTVNNLYIHDMRGNLVFRTALSGNAYTWDLRNMQGLRVPAGVYTIVCAQTDGTVKGTSNPVEVIVLAD